MASKLVVSIMGTKRFSANEQIAFARGCSLFDSRAYAMDSRRSRCSISFCVLIISVTFGFPVVRVPVLSTTTIWVLPVFSSPEAVLYKIPCFAPTLLPAMIATGAARPRAHGQLIMSTDTALESENPNPEPDTIHMTKVIIDRAIMDGMKIKEILSAVFAMGD